MDAQQTSETKPRIRPKDAATLIIVRGRGPKAEILMGQRSGGHVFMPNKFVFPGGRVDRGDSMVAPAADLQPHVEEKLTMGCSPRRARGIAMAAIRETFEETGLLVGTKTDGQVPTRSPSWRPFFENGVAPRLDILELIARAITPPKRPRRFDARFFMADAEHIQGDLHDTGNASGELLDLKWLPVDEAKTLDLPTITRAILDIVDQRLDLNASTVPIPFYKTGISGNVMEYL